MSDEASRSHPAHVPDELVLPFELDFRGPLDEVFPRMDALRDEGRVLWLRTGMGGSPFGTWLFTRADDIQTALHHPDLFSNRLGGLDAMPMMIPVMMDPPEHTQYRWLLNPLFAPGVVAKMEEGMQRRIDDLVDRDGCDFVADVAIQFPTRVFTSWMGLPEDETDTFVAMVRTLIGGGEAEGGADARGDAVNEAVTLLNTLIAGDPVILPLPLASRDPGAYPDLTEVRLDRSTVKHVAFGLGPHRCIGSHLARLEMRLAFDEWHVRIPDYRIDGDVMGYGGAVMGVTTLPFTWA